jgi:hypothetical protein
MAHHHVEEAVEMIASHHDSLYQVEIVRSPLRRTVQPKTLRTIFSSILCLPHMKRLDLMHFEEYDLDFVVDLIHMQDTIEFLRVQLATGSVSRDTLQALSTMTGLRVLTLGVHDSVPFREILASTSLESLYVVSSSDCCLHDDHAFELRQGVMTATSRLSSIEIEPTISASAFAMLCLTLRTNESVESLGVCLRGNSQDLKSVPDSLVLLLQSKNRTLRKIRNLSQNNASVTAHQKARLLQALECNTCLDEFSFFDEDRMFRWQKEMYLMRNRRQRDGGMGCSAFPKSPIRNSNLCSSSFSFYSCSDSELEFDWEVAKDRAVNMGNRVVKLGESLVERIQHF